MSASSGSSLEDLESTTRSGDRRLGRGVGTLLGLRDDRLPLLAVPMSAGWWLCGEKDAFRTLRPGR